MATADTVPGRLRLGLKAASLAFVAILVLLGLGVTSGETAAADTLPGTISVSKAEYIRICQATGGNPIEQSDGSVTCFFPDGSWSRCEFDTNTCQDSPAIGRPPSPVIVPPTGLIAEPGHQPAKPAVADAPAGSHATAAVDDDRKPHKDQHKKKSARGKKRGPSGKARKT